jgi:cysteine desulfurase
MKQAIYLDYAATTPVDPRVADVMGQCLTLDGVFANPASRSHVFGWQAEEKVETARGQVAELLNCDPREIVWTSGATEANNLAIKGLFENLDHHGHLITSMIEHKAVIDPSRWLESKGVSVTWLGPDADGVISVDKVAKALRSDTRLVSLMLVNNEIGSINPISEIGALCKENGVLLHVDAAQAAGKMPIDLKVLAVDLLSLSAHKFYGPKGVGALYVRRNAQHQLKPLIHGGGHERGLRSGTLPTHQLVGMGEAAKIAGENLQAEAQRVKQLRNKLWQGIQNLPSVRRNGSDRHVSAGHLNICLPGIDNETLLLSLRDLAVSSGSACTSASLEPSYVLKAIGLSDEDALASLRISLGRFTSDDDIDRAIAHIRATVSQLQAA